MQIMFSLPEICLRATAVQSILPMKPEHTVKMLKSTETAANTAVQYTRQQEHWKLTVHPSAITPQQQRRVQWVYTADQA